MLLPGTPMSAALEGAVLWGQAQLDATPGENVVIVFVTDGEPTECNQDIGVIAALAADGAAAMRATQRTLFKGLSETNRIHRAGRQSRRDGRVAEGRVRLAALA